MYSRDEKMKDLNRTDVPRFITLQEVSDRLSVGKSTILAWESDGQFCRPIKIGGRRVWLESDVIDWMMEQRKKSLLNLENKNV